MGLSFLCVFFFLNNQIFVFKINESIAAEHICLHVTIGTLGTTVLEQRSHRM